MIIASALPQRSYSSSPTSPVGVPTRRSGIRQTVYFFLDFSNIAISAGQIASLHGDSLLRSHEVRLDCQNLRNFVQRERTWAWGFAATGLNNQQSPLRRHFEQAGIELEICERGHVTGTEQNVDERIQLQMLRLLHPEVKKGTVVLASGDGGGDQNKGGFIHTLSILRATGFDIEVMSWRHSFNPSLKAWATNNGSAIELDDFYADLTFVEGGRRATSVHHLYRKLAQRGLV